MHKFAAAALFALFAVPASAEIVEAVIARVGDRIITRSQYAVRLADGQREIERTAPPALAQQRKDEFRRDLFDEMVAEMLIKDRADRLGLGVSQQEIDAAVQRLMVQYGLENVEAFESSLRESGLTRSEMEARLRDTLLTQKVFGRELRSRDEISDRELRQRYDREKDRYRLPERAKVREIVVVVPATATIAEKTALRAEVEEAAMRASNGEDFAALVGEYSDAPSKEQGGDIGTVAKGELLAAIDAAVFAAPAGTIAGPVETPAGFHILRVDERLPSEVPGFEAVRERLRREANEETFQRDYEAYIERLRREAYVQIFEENLPS